MAPKAQLCICSFQDSLRQKNWAQEQIRKFPDTIGYVWTAENDLNMLHIDAKIFVTTKKFCRKKISGFGGHDLSLLDYFVCKSYLKQMIEYYKNEYQICLGRYLENFRSISVS